MIRYFEDIVQGSDEWLAMRCGLLTASEMDRILTPSLKPAKNEKERTHLYELMAQRITGYVEPHYISDDMLRGHEDEVEAKILYAERSLLRVRDMGFITNDRWGFVIGYSPDGLVGEEGLIECKSRRQKYQAQTLIEHLPCGTIPAEHVLQVQTGLLVSERRWCDYCSYCGGLPMAIIRVFPDDKIQEAILEAADSFEHRLAKALDQYAGLARSGRRLIATKRRVELEIVV